MEGLKLIPYIALIIAISGIILGASVITLSEFGNTIDKCYNSSFAYNTSLGACANWGETTDEFSEPHSTDNFTSSYFTIVKAMEGETTVAEQIPTVAIIAVMVIIISIIAGVFVYMRYFA